MINCLQKESIYPFGNNIFVFLFSVIEVAIGEHNSDIGVMAEKVKAIQLKDSFTDEVLNNGKRHHISSTVITQF